MKKIENILVAINESAMSSEVLKRAISLAREKEARLTIIHIIETTLLAPLFTEAINKDIMKINISKEVDKLNAEVNIEYTLLIEEGSVSSIIAHKVKELKIDLLLIGQHGKDNIQSNYFGSTTLKLIQKTRIPVLIVKNEFKGEYKNILAPTNFSEYSKVSILFTKELFMNSSLKYLYVYRGVNRLYATRYGIDIVEQNQREETLKLDARLALQAFVDGVGGGEIELLGYDLSFNEDLLAYISKENPDLLVLGSKGTGNLNSFLFGSVASYLTQRTTSDVLVYVPRMIKDKKEDALIVSKTVIEKDLEEREEEIKDDLEELFEEHLKFTNWNVPEANNQEIADGLISILADKLNEINRKVKDGSYEEKRIKFWE